MSATGLLLLASIPGVPEGVLEAAAGMVWLLLLVLYGGAVLPVLGGAAGSLAAGRLRKRG